MQFTKKWAYGTVDGKVVSYFKLRGEHSIPENMTIFEVDTKEELPELDDLRTTEEKDAEAYRIKYAEALKEVVEERIATKKATK